MKTTLTSVQLDRRGFLTGLGLAVSSLPVHALPGNRSGSPALHGRAVFQQMAYFDFHGNGEAYQAPQGNASTRDYVNSMPREAFLRKHWFT